jgi:hypothetical protein
MCIKPNQGDRSTTACISFQSNEFAMNRCAYCLTHLLKAWYTD